MKRILALLLALLLLGGCGGTLAPLPKADETPPPDAVAPGADAPARDCTIGYIHGEALLLYDEEGGLYALNVTDLLLTAQDESALSVADLAVGQQVSVFFDGAVSLTYPASFGEPTKLIVRGESTDLPGLYLKLFDELWEKDAGLNEGISVLAFQFQDALCGLPPAPPNTPDPSVQCPHVLTQAQKNALFYILGNRLGYDVFESDFDSLQAENYIVKEPNSPMLHFPGGLFFQLTVNDWDNDGFTFEFSKWRSSLGAYFLADCKAICKSGVWNYTVGAEAIA